MIFIGRSCNHRPIPSKAAPAITMEQCCHQNCLQLIILRYH